MLAAPAIRHQEPTSGPRPFNPRRDGPQLYKLLDVCFGPVRDFRGRRYDFFQSGHLRNKPYLATLTGTDRRVAPGFVWEEGGDLIANVSIIRSPLERRFLIVNVAVHPDHRRKGLARRLMVDSLEHLRGKGVQEILLQVQDENEAAKSLYRSLGFSTLGAMNQWQSSTSKISLMDIDPADRVPITKLDPRQWRMAYQLDILALKPNLNWPAPPSKKKYKRGIWRWLNDFVNGRSTKTWVAGTIAQAHSTSQSGLVNLHSEWARPYQIELRLTPGYDPALARVLLGIALQKLIRSSGNVVRMDHEATDEPVNQILKEATFKTRRVLSVMRLGFEN